MEWWRVPGFVSLLVEAATNLDRENPQRPVYAVGHTPSWLVYAVGAVRTARGEQAKTGYIPFSGAVVEADREKVYKPMAEGDVVNFKDDSYRCTSPQAISSYFNFLSRHKLDPANVLRTSNDANERPVLVDFLARGNGFASFLRLYDQLAEQQQAGPVAQKFSITAYKLCFRDGAQDITVPAIANENGTESQDRNERTYTLNLKTGKAADALNVISGYQGCPGQMDASIVAKEKGRFMPYYPVIDGYKGHWSKQPAPTPGLRTAKPEHTAVREIKAAIREAVKVAQQDPVKHKELVAQGEAYLEQTMPKPRNQDLRWVPFFGGYH